MSNINWNYTRGDNPYEFKLNPKQKGYIKIKMCVKCGKEIPFISGLSRYCPKCKRKKGSRTKYG